MVATLLSLLSLIALCTLISSTAIQRPSSSNHLRENAVGKRQDATASGVHVNIGTSKLGGHNTSDAQNGSNMHNKDLGSEADILPRSTEDTVIKAGPEGYAYHHFSQTTGDDQEQRQKETLASAMDTTMEDLHVKRQVTQRLPV